MRLAKHLAHAGVASRRASEALIAEGRVTVGGEVVRDPARDVDGTVEVAVDGRSLAGIESHVVYAVHKPVGVLSTAADPFGRPIVLNLVPDEQRRLYPVGRLDLDSSGLILLTNDGTLAHALTHPRFEVEKTYRVKLAGGDLSDAEMAKLRDGVKLQDGVTAPAKARRLPRADGAAQLELTIREGRNRQVRRMCEAVGHRVLGLRRTAFGPLQLGGLRAGEHRRLSEAELQALRRAASTRPLALEESGR